MNIADSDNREHHRLTILPYRSIYHISSISLLSAILYISLLLRFCVSDYWSLFLELSAHSLIPSSKKERKKKKNSVYQLCRRKTRSLLQIYFKKRWDIIFYFMFPVLFPSHFPINKTALLFTLNLFILPSYFRV